jgi:hypothetical protein
MAARSGQILLVSKNHDGWELSWIVALWRLHLLEPARTSGPERSGVPWFKPLSQFIRSLGAVWKRQLELSVTAIAYLEGIAARIPQRILSLAVMGPHVTAKKPILP